MLLSPTGLCPFLAKANVTSFPRSLTLNVAPAAPAADVSQCVMRSQEGRTLLQPCGSLALAPRTMDRWKMLLPRGISSLVHWRSTSPVATQAATGGGVAGTADLLTATNYVLPKLQGDGGAAQEEAFVPIPVNQWHKDPVLMSGCEADGPRLNVAVLLSGGVDSSLALQLLVAAGHRCKAFYLQIWFQEDFRNFWDACPWEEDLEYAKQVCDALGVELEVVPLTRAYWDSVVAHSVAQIRAGRTPNPDMLCNSRVKFGAFLDLLEARGAMAGAGGTKAVQPGPAQGAGRAADGHSEEGAGSVAETLQVFDRVASGHYARVVRSQQAGCAQLVREQRMRSGAPADTSAAAAAAAGSAGNELTDPLAVISSSSSSSGGGAPNGNKELSATDCGSNDSSGGSSSSNGSGAHLALSADPVKDQSYFLAQLSPRQLSRVMFPLGGLTKRQVRQLAMSAGLATQARKDSQGICFLGKVKFPEFVKEHLGEWPGLIVVDRDYDTRVQQQQQQQQQQPLDRAQEDIRTDTPPQRQPPSGSQQRGRRRMIKGAGAGSGGAANVVAEYGSDLVLGLHQGYWFYTVGQRGGIKLPGGPWYVTRKDSDLNIVYVSRRYVGSAPGAGADSAGALLLQQPHTAFATAPFSWLSDARPRQDPNAPPLFCKVRHGPHAYHCSLLPMAPSVPVDRHESALPTVPFPQSESAPVHSNAGMQGAEQHDSAVQSSVLSGEQQQQQRHHHHNHNQRHQDDRLQKQQQQQQHWPSCEGSSWCDGTPLVVVLWGRDQGLAAGQYAVLYQGGQCLGAAQMERSLGVGDLAQVVEAAAVDHNGVWQVAGQGSKGLMQPQGQVGWLGDEGSEAVVLTGDM